MKTRKTTSAPKVGSSAIVRLKGEPVRGLENEAVVAYPSIVRESKNTFGGLSCHVCGNKNRNCPNCGGPGTPWLI